MKCHFFAGFTDTFLPLARSPRRSRSAFATAFATCIAVLFTVSPAHGMTTYLMAARLVYPNIVGTQLNSCSLCHAAGDNRNPFGQDFEANGLNFDAIKNLDSDSDGYANETEILSLTFPGNPLSFPFLMGTLKVNRPKNGDTWTIGEKRLVKWTSTGEVGANVRIELWQNGAKVATLKKSVPNDGKQRVKLDDGITPGNGYTIKVISLAEPSISDESNKPISIVAPDP